MKQLKHVVLAASLLAATNAIGQATDGSSTESPMQPSSQGHVRSSGPSLGGPEPGTNATRASGSEATVTPDGNKAMGTGIRAGSDSASTSDHATSRTWAGVGSTGGATGTGTSSGTSDESSAAAAGITPPAPGSKGNTSNAGSDSAR